MPISEQLLDILCCPRTKVPVHLLDDPRLQRLNAVATAGRLRYADGSSVDRPLEEALVTADGETVYRIDASIPVMLVDRAIPTAQIPDWRPRPSP